GIHQFGHARAQGWSLGEGGGGGGAPSGSGVTPNFNGPGGYTRLPTTVQNKFDELDAFLSYKFALGPIDITLGDIAFFISRRATTYEKDVLVTVNGQQFFWRIPDTDPPLLTLSPDPTVEDEVFYRSH